MTIVQCLYISISDCLRLFQVPHIPSFSSNVRFQINSLKVQNDALKTLFSIADLEIIKYQYQSVIYSILINEHLNIYIYNKLSA